MRYSLIVFFPLFLLFSCQSIAQETQYEYKDYFQLRKNKHVIYGQLISYKLDTIEIELESGYRVKMLTDDFRVIRQHNESKSKSISLGKVLNTRLEGPFLLDLDRRNFFDVSIGANFLANDDFFTGLKLELTYKRRFHKNFFATGSYALEMLSGFEPVYVHPLTAGLEYVLLLDKVKPYLRASGGYGFVHVMDQSNFGQWDVRGGPRYSVGGGFLFKAAGQKVFRMGVDFINQPSFFETVDNGWWISSNRDVVFRRLFFKLGFMF